MAYIEMYPEYILALQQELTKHPDLQQKLNPGDSFASAIAAIAAELNILMDGMYDMKPTCEMLVRKLQERRTLLILPIGVKVS
jgi:hypothetical protein